MLVAVRFALSQDLVAKLRAHRIASLVPSFVRNVVGGEPIYIGGTVGLFWFLTPDGRVLEVLETQDPPGVREAQDDDATWILAEFAHDGGVPELLELLPPPPPAASTACSDCRGTRYVRLGDATFACHACHGRGWRAA